jgi:hypothetical protein
MQFLLKLPTFLLLSGQAKRWEYIFIQPLNVFKQARITFEISAPRHTNSKLQTSFRCCDHNQSRPSLHFTSFINVHVDCTHIMWNLSFNLFFAFFSFHSSSVIFIMHRFSLLSKNESRLIKSPVCLSVCLCFLLINFGPLGRILWNLVRS